MKIAIVGLGLIGGSMAKDLSTQINVEVLGVDASEEHGQMAVELGLIHRVVDLQEAMSTADFMILATPVDVIEKRLPKLLTDAPEKLIITDVGSTKSGICKAIAQHPKRGQFVASHPLAGTEFSGPAAATKGLFSGAKNIICEKDRSSEKALSLAQKVFESLGMSSFYLSAEEHDKHLAYVSHLSHVTSFTLGLTVLDIEKDEKQIFNLASTGFASTARLAKSNPRTWAAIFAKNKDYLSIALEGYIQQLRDFKSAIEEQDEERLISLMETANDIKRILE